MVDPQYQELLKADIPNVSKDGVHVAVIAGEALGTNVSINSIQQIIFETYTLLSN